MDAFVAKHEQSIRGVLSCFDRVLFRGYVPLMSGYAMAEFLQRQRVRRHTLKAFLLTQAERVKKHGLAMAAQAQRPYQYLTGPCRKEELARQMAQRDGITEGRGPPCARASPFSRAIKRSAGSVTVATSTRWRRSTIPRPPSAHWMP